jgi:hypothetical protein
MSAKGVPGGASWAVGGMFRIESLAAAPIDPTDENIKTRYRVATRNRHLDIFKVLRFV